MRRAKNLPENLRRRRLCLSGVATVFALVWVLLTLSQGSLHGAVPVIEPGNTNVNALITGGTSLLLSRILSLPIDTNASGGRIEFNFGFATQETAGSGELVDSLTLTMLDDSERYGAVLLVSDLNGVLWLPCVPGSVSVPPSSLSASTVDLPEIRLGLAGFRTQLAYHLSVRIPPALWSSPIKLALDVFDYPNGLNSVAWVSDLRFVPDLRPTCAPPPRGWIANWAADGDGLDSVAGLNATLSSGLTFANGRAGQAFGFDGTDSAYVEVPHRIELSPQLGSYPPTEFIGGEVTIEAWMQMPTLPSSSEGHRTIVAKDGEYELAVRSDGKVVFTVWASDQETVAAEGGPVTVGSWHHVAGTFRQGQFVRVYLDGVRVGETALSSLVARSEGAPLLFGRPSLNRPGHYFRGFIDDVGLYHHALSDADVASIQAAAGAGKCGTPLVLDFELRPQALRLRWARSAGGATLVYSDALGSAARWRPAEQSPSTFNEDIYVDVPLGAAARFYRLRR